MPQLSKPFAPRNDAERAECEAFVLKHRGLIYDVIYRHFRRNQPLMEDMIQYGMIGLMQAWRDHDPTRGTVATIACWKIRGQIGAYLERERRAKRIPVANLDFDEQLESPPPPKDVSAAKEAAVRVLNALPARTQAVMRMHILEGRTLAYVGARIGVSRERVRQIKDEGIAALRKSKRLPAIAREALEG